MLHSKVVTIKRGKKGMTTHYIIGSMIWLNYYVDGVRIRKSTKLKNTPQNIKIVIEKIIPALDAKIATGEIYKKKPKTFEYYGNIFLKQKDSNKSYHLKQGYYKKVIEHFAGQSIDTITRLDIKEYLNSFKITSKSKCIYKTTCKEIFELAVDDGVISFNPALDIKLKADVRKDVEYYTKDEVNKLLSSSTGIMRAYLFIAFNTGMRVGEILGLQLSDFKDDGYIHIKRTRTKGIIGTGKTNNAIRKVPYPRFILDEVRSILTNHVFIFNNISDASLLRSQWSKVLADSGVPKYKLSSTRHTFATLMLK
ncbi:MAG: tyrosine-type recombinase/integrase, partial [Sulfurimonas sp.]|nr:tyrosine-type recombinase/integrase [Sulfurimonas sp.]